MSLNPKRLYVDTTISPSKSNRSLKINESYPIRTFSIPNWRVKLVKTSVRNKQAVIVESHYIDSGWVEVDRRILSSREASAWFNKVKHSWSKP